MADKKIINLPKSMDDFCRSNEPHSKCQTKGLKNIEQAGDLIYTVTPSRDIKAGDNATIEKQDELQEESKAIAPSPTKAFLSRFKSWISKFKPKN